MTQDILLFHITWHFATPHLVFVYIVLALAGYCFLRGEMGWGQICFITEMS